MTGCYDLLSVPGSVVFQHIQRAPFSLYPGLVHKMHVHVFEETGEQIMLGDEAGNGHQG